MSFYKMRGFGDDDYVGWNASSTIPPVSSDSVVLTSSGSSIPYYLAPNPSESDDGPGSPMGPNIRTPLYPASTDDGPGNPMGSQNQFISGQGVASPPPMPSLTAGAPLVSATPAANSSGGGFLSSAQGLLNIFGQAVGSHPTTNPYATYNVASATPTWILPVALIGGVALIGIVLVSTHKSPSMGRYKRRSKR